MTNEYKLAPSVPTDEMLNACKDINYLLDGECSEYRIYTAMLEDAPTLVEVDVDDLFYTIVNAIDAERNKSLDATHQYIVKDTLNHLAAQGYLRTPDTEKDRVLELMAGALEHWVQHSHHPCQLTDEALSEYEKLKGGA